MTDNLEDLMDELDRTPVPFAGDEDPDLAWCKGELAGLIQDALCFLEPEEIAVTLDRCAADLRGKPDE